MSPFHLFRRKAKPLATICPHCHQEDGRNRNLARRIGGTVGGVAGAACGVSGILSAARLGLVLGSVAGPAGSVITAVAAATLRGIVGGTIGCEVGTALGGLLDKHVLQNDTCRHCGFPHDDEEAHPVRLQSPPWPQAETFPMGPGDDDPDPDDEPFGGAPIPT